MELKESTIENPLQWFDCFFLNHGLIALHAQFKTQALEQDGYFMPAMPYTGFNDESTYYIDKEVSEDLLMVGYRFSTYVEQVLSKQYSLTIYNIDRKSELIDDANRPAFYNKIGNVLNSYFEIAKQIKIESERKAVENILRNLQDYISSKLMVSPSHEEVTNNIFGFKKGTKSIPLLYSALVDIEFFSEEDDQLSIFKEVLTSYASNSNAKLKVSCTIEKAAYVFQKLQKFFHHLTPTTIEKTEVFINKRGKIIVANDIFKALNKYNEKILRDPEITTEIDTILDHIV